MKALSIVCLLMVLVSVKADQFGAFEITRTLATWEDGEYVGFEKTQETGKSPSAYTFDWYRDVLETPVSSILQAAPGDEMQGFGTWFALSDLNPAQTHNQAFQRWTRNGANSDRLDGNWLEVRFTLEENTARDLISEEFMTIPFEAWFLGTDPLDTSDDIKMVVQIWDFDQNGLWESELTDAGPATERIYLYLNSDVPGDSGYQAFKAGTAGVGVEYLARLSFLNYRQFQGGNGTAWSGPLNARPDRGSIFRFQSGHLPPVCGSGYEVAVTQNPDEISVITHVACHSGLTSVTAVPNGVVSFAYGQQEGSVTFSPITAPLEYYPSELDYTNKVTAECPGGVTVCDVGAALNGAAFHTVGRVGLSLTATGFNNLGFTGLNGAYPLRSENAPIQYLYDAGFVIASEGGANIWSGFDEIGSVFEPLGRFKTQADISDQDILVTAVANRISVTRRTMAWASAGYVIVSHTLTNTGSSAIRDIDFSIFADPDLNLEAFDDKAGVDEGRQLVYQFKVGHPEIGAFGIIPLNSDWSNYGSYIIGEDPTNDTLLYEYMTTTALRDSGEAGNDVRIVTTVFATGSLAPRESHEVVHALVFGRSVADLQTNADLARARFSAIFGVYDDCWAIYDRCKLTSGTDKCFDCLSGALECLTRLSGRTCPRPEDQKILSQDCRGFNCNSDCCDSLSLLPNNCNPNMFGTIGFLDLCGNETIFLGSASATVLSLGGLFVSVMVSLFL